MTIFLKSCELLFEADKMVFSDSLDKSQASFHPFNSSPGSFTGVSPFEKFGDQGFQFGAKTTTYRGIEMAIFFILDWIFQANL